MTLPIEPGTGAAGCSGSLKIGWEASASDEAAGLDEVRSRLGAAEEVPASELSGLTTAAAAVRSSWAAASWSAAESELGDWVAGSGVETGAVGSGAVEGVAGSGVAGVVGSEAVAVRSGVVTESGVGAAPAGATGLVVGFWSSGFIEFSLPFELLGY